jgi:anti-anti-sigma factor
VEEAVYYKEAAGTGFVRAEGHVTALLCPSLKARVFADIDSPSPPGRIEFDLGPCEYMDSTFLGLIVGVCKRIKARSGGRVVIRGANEACLGLLRTIGVLGLVDVSSEPMPPLEGMERIGGGAKATARFILDAHEDLSALSEENRSRFSALNSALRGAVESEEKGGRD